MTQDPNRTILGAPPTLDPNRTILGTAPSLNATQTIKPVQCPVCKTFNPPGVIYCVDCGLIFDRALPPDAFGAPAVQLPVLIDPQGREYPLRMGANVLGRQGDLIVEDTRVSRRHAQIDLEGSQVWASDLGSTNGTKVRGLAIAAGQRVQLSHGETVDLGGWTLTLAMPGESAKTQMPVSNKTAAIQAAPSIEGSASLEINGEKVTLKEGVNRFGRRAENDVVIADPYVSGSHGTFELIGDEVYLTDTGSSNGTLVNDAKLEFNQKTRLSATDVVRIGTVEIRVLYRTSENHGRDHGEL